MRRTQRQLEGRADLKHSQALCQLTHLRHVQGTGARAIFEDALYRQDYILDRFENIVTKGKPVFRRMGGGAVIRIS